ncbi:MAG: methyltransferase domain-containing protein [Myxococcales bacterium]|nr:methyltransferase domain-containing protein [Myxococcales bacterium]
MVTHDEGHLEHTRRYYDAFSRRYDAARGGRVPGGYHDLVDDLELDFLSRHARGKSVLEVGCGTGLLLERMRDFAGEARGIDLSPGMLERARSRGLDVVEGSATSLPFPDASFDVACSFKVLAHVRDVRRAVGEMLRVVRPGGVVVAEFYNARSLRALVKRLGPAGAVAHDRDESEVYTRFDTPAEVAGLFAAAARIIDRRGVRIVTPAARALELPVVGSALRRAEQRLCDTVLARYAGFLIVAARKHA